MDTKHNLNIETNITSTSSGSSFCPFISPTSSCFKYEFEKSERSSLHNLEFLMVQLQRDLVPQVMFEMQTYSDIHFKQLGNTVANLKRIMKNLHKFVNTCKKLRKGEKNVICYDEEAIFRGLVQAHKTKQLSKDTAKSIELPCTTNIQLNNCDVADGIINGEIKSRLQEINLDKKIAKSKSAPISKSKPYIQQNVATFKECCEIAKKGAEFRFNFNITGFDVFKSIYESLANSQNCIKVGNATYPTIQKKSSYCFSCLICFCEVPCTNKRFNVGEHINGNKHQKRLTEVEILESVKNYHQQWSTHTEIIQAHQVYFYPQKAQGTKNILKCSLCSLGVSVESLESHIKSPLHKSKLLIMMPSATLFNVQILVYPEEYLRNNPFKVPFKKEPVPTSTDTSSNSSENSNITKKKPLIPTKHIPNRHKIVKSVANPAGSTSKDLLEYRFHSHLKFIETNANDTFLKCIICNVQINKTMGDLKLHLYSRGHLIKLPNLAIKKFYCDPCELHLKENERWIKHLLSSVHITKCSQLDISRRRTLTEYQCCTCRMVIYGDEETISNHKMTPKKSIELVGPVKELFSSINKLNTHSEELVKAANDVLSNQEPIRKCCADLEAALVTVFSNGKVYPFGSRVSGLGSKKSDLDVFVDIGDMYTGEKNQDKDSQENYVYTAVKVFRKLKSEFKNISAVAFARTPIVQLVHIATNIDCDLSFRHGLSVENTKFLRFCIKLQPGLQNLILLLKEWMSYCPLNESISTYGIAMLAIFYFQVNKYLLPVYTLKKITNAGILNIDGWTIPKFEEVEAEIDSIKSQITTCNEGLKFLLLGFFKYYNEFSFLTEVVCPLLGRSIEKANFLLNPDGSDLPEEMEEYIKKAPLEDSELFRVKPMCIQDPFDLSHNLTKAISSSAITQFQTYCLLSYKFLEENCL